MPTKEALLVGDLVSLEVKWGNQSRLKCPACRHFTTGVPDVYCRCGAIYRAEPGGPYRVLVLP